MPNWPATNNLNNVLSKVVEVALAVPLGKLRYGLLVLIGVWFLSLLADFVWMWFPASVNSNSVIPITTPAITASQHTDVDVVTMQSWNLFGAASATLPEIKTSEDVPDDATLTSLQLVLLGVLMSDTPENSFAIIQSPTASGLYKVGENIPVANGVVLSKVLVDRVIISNRGNMEALLLYTESGKPPMAVPVLEQSGSKSVMDQRNNPELSRMAADYKNRLFSNPASLTDLIKVSIAKDADGRTIGYRIRPGRSREQFAQFGLQAGDVVTSINGTPLDDPAKAMQLYGQLREATEASFVVQRGNQEINLIVGLKQ